MSDRIERTSYLDGLRGWAALVVLLQHSTLQLMPNVEFFQSTLLRFPTDGILAVYIFFVISGFALSIGYIRSKNVNVLQSLCISRYFRLTIPILIVTLATYVLISRQMIFSQYLAEEIGPVAGWLHNQFAFPASFLGALQFSMFDVYFKYLDGVSYNSSLWTMNAEFKGSFIVFCVLAIFGSVKTRVFAYALLIAATAYLNTAFLCFVLGIGIAELSQQPYVQRIRYTRAAHSFAFAILISCVMASTFCRSLYQTIFLPLIAAAFVLTPVISEGVAQFFGNATSVFLGSISFPLYLVQVPIICSIGSLVYLSFIRAEAPAIISIGTTFFVTVGVSIMSATASRVFEALAIRTSRGISRFLLENHWLALRVSSKVAST
jgi:peptidoglycan/LPS O-acetylase OafA/YrhL